MNGPDRFRTLVGRATEAADGDLLGCLEGVDPVTGLPVLIYDFDGVPLASPGDIDSANVPTILWSSSEGGRGRIVVALAPGWQRLEAESGPLTLDRLLDATRAVRDAADVGVMHGDLSPRRLLLVEGRLQIEGFGVPWRPRAGEFRAPEVSDAATLAGDIYALARTVEALGHSAGDETVSAVLEQCTAEDPLDRPSAEELYLAIESLAVQQREADQSRAKGTPGAERRSTEGAADDGGAPTAASEHRSAGSEGRTTGTAETRAANGTASSPSEHRAGATKDPATDVARVEPPRPLLAPPPDEEPRQKRVSLILLGVLMAAVVILALLALYGPRGSGPTAPKPLEDTVYVVEVEVVPTDLPPVAIHVVRAPEGSSLGRSDTIGTAPRHLALDRPGPWAFQGSLQGRTSDVVEIEVPQERTVTLVMPPAATE